MRTAQAAGRPRRMRLTQESPTKSSYTSGLFASAQVTKRIDLFLLVFVCCSFYSVGYDVREMIGSSEHVLGIVPIMIGEMIGSSDPVLGIVLISRVRMCQKNVKHPYPRPSL